MLKKLLPVLLFISFSPAFAQEIVKEHSIPLFRIGSGYISDKGILLSKGIVTEIKPDTSSEFVINVFKQFSGGLSLDPTVKRKGLVSGSAVLPGLAQYTYGEDGFELLKEKTFSLNSGLKSPFKYTFYEANGAMNKTQAKSMEKILGSDAMGGDYNKLREMAPSAVRYQGDVWVLKELTLNNNGKTVQYRKTALEYVPFMASYDVSGAVTLPGKTFQIKTNPKGGIYFVRNLKMIYFGPPEQQKVAVMSIDTTGTIEKRDEIEIIKDMEVVAFKNVIEEVRGEWVNNRSALSSKGMDLLMSTTATDRKKGKDYKFVRLDETGKVLYHHSFQLELEDFIYNSAKIYSNDKETIAEIFLSKGLLKTAVFYIKIRPEGIVYTHRYKMNLSLKVNTPDGKSQLGGSNNDVRLISLPNDENLLLGYLTDVTEAKSGQLINYGATLLDKDGAYKSYFNAKAQVPASALMQRPAMAHFTLPDGRILVSIDEPRDNAGTTFNQFSLLDAELCKDYSVKAEEIEPDKKSILYKSTALAPKEAPVDNSVVGKGIRLFEKVSAATERTGFSGLRSEEPAGKKQQQNEGETMGFSPSLLVIDVQNQSIRQLDFHKLGGYSLYNQPYLWVNKTTGEARVFVRSLPQPLPATKKGGSSKFPVDVYLKAYHLKF